MNRIKTTIVLPEPVFRHIKIALAKNRDIDKNVSEFLARAAVNQLEKDYDDFDARIEMSEGSYEESR